MSGVAGGQEARSSGVSHGTCLSSSSCLSVPGGEDVGKAYRTRIPFSSGSAFAQMVASPTDGASFKGVGRGGGGWGRDSVSFLLPPCAWHVQMTMCLGYPCSAVLSYSLNFLIIEFLTLSDSVLLLEMFVGSLSDHPGLSSLGRILSLEFLILYVFVFLCVCF